MMTGKVLLLSGDGAGPAVMKSVETVLMATTSEVEVLHGSIGHNAYEETGHYLPHDTLDLLDECKHIICGPTIKPETGISPMEALSVQLDLFARVRYFKTMVPGNARNIDVLLWGSNNFPSKEITEVPDLEGVTLSKYIKNNAYSRMMTLALDFVESKRNRKVTCLTRDDYFPMTSGMFSDAFDAIFQSDRFSTETMDVRKWVVETLEGKREDECVICVDLYRQIVGGVLGGLTGHDHLCPRALLGTEYRLFEPFSDVTNSEGVLYDNPTPALLSLANILNSFDLKEEGKSISDAVMKTFANNEMMADLGGDLDIEHFTEKVISYI
jgi:isocitrate/isopropylmalate dehydrogenase